MLAQAEIRPFDPPAGEAISVLFNPTQYGLDASSTFSEVGGFGQTGVLQYTSGKARQLSVELFFDTYENGTDVRVHTNKVYKLVDIEPTTHRPPIVAFTWGGLNFVCVVERVNGRFTLFLDSGVPVRATLTVAFKEYVEPRKQPLFNKTQSSDHVKTYVVQRGDSISSIAAAEYGDPATWRPIAIANAIDNPRALEPGRRIVIPPLPSRLGSA